MSEEERKAKALAVASSAGARNGDIGAIIDEDFSPPRNADGGFHPTVGQPEAEAPSVHQLLLYLAQLNLTMQNMMAMMHRDRPQIKAERLANVRLDERNFRTALKYNNLRSGWKEWMRQVMAAVRECDVGVAKITTAFERRGGPIDHIHEFNPPQCQLAINLHNRLSSLTTGTAFQIVESVPRYNGIEAWRLLNFQYDPKDRCQTKDPCPEHHKP